MKANQKPKIPSVIKLLLDQDTSLEMRRAILIDVVQGDEEVARAVLARLLEAAASEGTKAIYELKKQELEELLDKLSKGPLLSGNFIADVHSPGLGRRASVVLADGMPASCPVPDAELERRLRPGDAVWIDPQTRALLFHEPSGDALGEEAELERWLPDGHVELKLGEQGRFVFRAAATLLEQRERGEAEPGTTVVVCSRRRFAWRALPSEAGFANFRYLTREAIPDVVVERDIGGPAAFVGEFIAHLRRELEDPELARRYGMRRSLSRLLTGVPGSGKTFNIHGFWNLMYAELSEHTGVPAADLPPRVMQLRVPEVLSRWVGVADQNIARFFDEAAQLAAEPFTTPDGREVELPLLLIIEECDAWARERGEDGIHDRIQATLLTYLDPANELFRERLVFVVCTTNMPQLVDSAFVRRVGGVVETFGRLDRAAFGAVLEKHLARRPFHRGVAAPGDAACAGDEARAVVVQELVAWLHAPNTGEPGVVTLTFAGQQDPSVFHRRDFLTAALVDRAVQNASADACDAEWRGAEDPGLTTALLASHLDRQVRQIVDQLDPRNAGRYLTLPDSTRVLTVRRISQPIALPLELERAS